MAEGAPFGRIVLINSVNNDFQYEFLRRVGRYTHIQSINGILLDGLTIEKVTDVFRKLPEHHVQLMVRYVHMAVAQDNKPQEEEPREESQYLEHPQLPCRQSLTSIAPEQMRQKSHTPASKPNTSLSIPLPVFLLGDNHQLCKELFKVLSDDSPTTPSTDTPTNTVLTNRLPMNGSTLYTPQPTANNRVLMMRSTSIPATSSAVQPSNGVVDYHAARNSHSSQSSDDITDLDTLGQLYTTTKQSPAHVRRRSTSIKGTATSDRYMKRREIPTSKFEKLPEVKIPNLPSSVKSPLSPDEVVPLPQQQYILHLPSQDLDRQMVHLYFKLSGLYIVVIGLEDLISNPLCHTENLFYWVNLIHTYVTPTR